MNSSIINDESILHLNSDELKIKRKRRASNFNIDNKIIKKNYLKSPARLSKSISKLTVKKLENFNKKEKNNVIKDYLHSHKFGIQRRNSKKITVKLLKSKINKSFLSNKNVNECVSMMYFPN